MANRKVTINIATTANTSGAQQATTAMTNLTTATNAATTATATTGKAASRVGSLVGQAGYQVQDFAVQVGAGTSALTAFAQQAPQLLGAFGPAGAIAGAFVAIGAIATKVFMSIGDDAMSAEEKAKKFTKELAEVAKAAEKSVDDQIDFGKRAIEEATTEAEQYAAELNNVADNQIRLNKVIFDSMMEVSEAEQTLKELRGESTDALKQQSEQAAADAQRREAEMNTLLAAEQQKLKAAADAVEIAKNDLAAKETQKLATETILKNEQAALKIAEERLKTTEKLAEKSLSSQIFGPLVASAQTVSPAVQQQAQQQLDEGTLQKEVETLKNRVSKMAEAISASGELTDEIVAAEANVRSVESQFRQATEDVKSAMQSINIEAISGDIKATSDQLKERATLLGDEVKTITEGVTASTQSEKAALETIKQKLADGKIDLTEINQTSTALTELGPRIREAINGNSQKVATLITIMNEMKSQSDQQQRRIDDLQRRMSTPSPQR